MLIFASIIWIFLYFFDIVKIEKGDKFGKFIAQNQ